MTTVTKTDDEADESMRALSDAQLRLWDKKTEAQIKRISADPVAMASQPLWLREMCAAPS